MARTVQKILEDDKTKADLGVDEDTENKDIVVEDKGPTPEETAEDLKRQLKEANERTAREAEKRREAEERASSSQATAATAAQSQVATQEAAIESKIAAAKTGLDSIKQQLKQARAAGDSDAEIELQDAMTNARYELNTATWEKNNFDRWKANQVEAAKQQTAAPKSPYTAKEQAWIDAHPEFNSNKKFSRVAKLAAQEALDEGHAQDTPGYFAYIEKALEESGLTGGDDSALSGAGRNTASTSVAAAPSRTGNGAAPAVNKNSKYPYVPNGFRIPADWVEAAEMQGFDDPREYANMRLEEDAKAKGAA